MPAFIEQRAYRTVEELGKALIEAQPEKYGSRDPAELGRAAKDLIPGVSIQASDFGDIDPGITLGNFPGSSANLAGRTVVGAAEMAQHPIETGESLFAAGKVALMNLAEAAKEQGPREQGEASRGTLVEAGRTLLSKLAGVKLTSDEQREEVESVGREFKESFEPRNIQDDPAEFLSNLATVFPARGTATAAAKLGVKGAAKTRKVLDFVDPASAPFAVVGGGLRLGKNAVKKVPAGVRKAKDLLLEPVIGRVRKNDRSFRTELFDSLVGFTAGNGPLFVKELRELAGATVKRVNEKGQQISEQVSDIVRGVTKSSEPGVANDTLLRRALRNADRIKDKADAAFEAGKARIVGLRAPLDITDLQQRARGVLEEFNVGTAEVPSHVTLRGTDTPTDVGVLTREKTGKFRLEFPDFGEGKGSTTTISDIGNGRQKLNEIFIKFMEAPGLVTAEELMNFRRKIDDALTVATGETSAGARSSLMGLRSLLRDDLNNRVPGYRTTMKDYETNTLRSERYEEELGVAAGRLNDEGLFREATVEGSLSKLLGTMNDKKEAATRLPLLKEFQALGGDHSLLPLILGIGSEPLLGSGLVVKSQISEISRVVVGAALLGAGAVTALKTAPAINLFSPRGMSEWILSAGERRGQGLGATFPRSRDKIAEIQKVAEELSQRAQEIDRLTGGKLKEMAARKGMKVGVLIERLQGQAGAEISGLEFPEEEKQSLLGTLGKSQTPAGIRLER